mgnify:FL=1
MEAEQREELRRLADQCICHPLSRGVRDVEQAGEAIKELLDELADTEKAYALLFAENARLRSEVSACSSLVFAVESAMHDGVLPINVECAYDAMEAK